MFLKLSGGTICFSQLYLSSVNLHIEYENISIPKYKKDTKILA